MVVVTEIVCASIAVGNEAEKREMEEGLGCSVKCPCVSWLLINKSIFRNMLFSV